MAGPLHGFAAMPRYDSREWTLVDATTMKMSPVRIPVAALPTREPEAGARGPRHKRETMRALCRDARMNTIAREPRAEHKG